MQRVKVSFTCGARRGRCAEHKLLIMCSSLLQRITVVPCMLPSKADSSVGPPQAEGCSMATTLELSSCMADGLQAHPSPAHSQQRNVVRTSTASICRSRSSDVLCQGTALGISRDIDNTRNSPKLRKFGKVRIQSTKINSPPKLWTNLD